MTAGGDPSVGSLLRADRTAVIVVDVQNDYCDPSGVLGRAGHDLAGIDEMVSVIERLLRCAREAGALIVFLKTTHSDHSDTPSWRRRSDEPLEICRVGSWGAEFHRLAPNGDDPVVVKSRYSGFVGTNLAQVLAAHRRTTLVVVGTATHVCVESTVRDAVMHDYDVFVAEDGVAATDDEAHRASLAVLDRFFARVIPSKWVIDVWSGERG